MTNIQPPMENLERPDPVLTNKIVTHLKSQGIFDQFRKECMADVDTKPAYHNLRQRVEGSVAAFLKMNPWRPDMNKNQLRDNLRKHIKSGGFLDIGVDRIVDQVVNPKIYTVFLPKVEEVVQSCLAMENDKPKFEPPPTEVKTLQLKSEPPKFQDKHNLAPRAKLPAPLMGPTIKPMKPTEQVEGKSSPVQPKSSDNGAGDTEETGDKKYVVDEDDPEEKDEEDDDDDDDEESPPFEPHSEGDRMILGMRSDTSENSNDSQVVTTIVDDSLEGKIDNNQTIVKEESDKKDEDSSSDEYVPKTPTINMEESDGTVLEFNSISEYKQYQTKFEDESFGNVEEVVESQSISDNIKPSKEERSSNEEESVSGQQKRKFNSDSYDEISSSGSDRESTSDEIKPAVFESFSKKRFKIDEYDNETSEFSVNEDSCTDKSLDMSDSKFKILETGHQEKHQNNSTSSKDSGKNYHVHKKEHRDSSNHHSSKNKTPEKDRHEKNRSSHSTKDKKHKDKKNEKHESSKDDHKERERKKSESSNKHSEKDKHSKHYDKEKEKDREKKSKSSERSKKDKEDVSKVQKESKNDQKDHRQDYKSRSDHDKDKKKHSSRDKYSDGKKESDHKNRKDESKHTHSSGSHSHSQSSEKTLSDKNHKHRESADKHRSGDKKNGKEESKKKYREHCKYGDKDENRRSSDRDSSGPSESTHVSSSSKSRSSRCHKESKDESGERTSSNSDNTVSDNVESLQNNIKLDSPISECGIMSPDTKLEKETFYESELMKDDLNCSIIELNVQNSEPKNLTEDDSNREQGENLEHSVIIEDGKEIYNASTSQIEIDISENTIVPHICLPEQSTDTELKIDMKQDSTNSSVSLIDSSSEKENIEQDTKEQINSEFDGNSTDASLDEECTVVKFKKPKIAKNIHEVKKIMEARRHLKRMEKKRMKLLTKSTSEEYESGDKSPIENTLDESQSDIFRGFEDNVPLDKFKTYECLTERLENEISQLEKLTNHEQVNSNLITSWVDLDPDLDVYIENTLKGKVHRMYRVRLPPICEEYYNYNAEQNFYVLVENWDACEQMGRMVDSNLNNLSPIHPTTQQENINACRVNSKKGKLEYGTETSMKEEISSKDCVYSKQNHLKLKIVSKNAQSEDEVITLDESNASNNSGGKKTTDVIAPQTNFSLTFNQTYDEVLKEKAQNSVVPPKKEIDEMNKTPLTVVRITKNKSSEQVFLKKIQSNTEEKNQVPRITRSDSVINGKLFDPPESKQVPLISRITKQKNIATSKITHQHTNGIVSSNSRRTFEEELQRNASQKIMNDVIGIHVSSDQDNMNDHRSQLGEGVVEQKRKRATGCRQQQRYDSSDLYKPRPQLSSRRVRSVGSSPEEPSVLPVAGRRKRLATSDPDSSPSKRRR